MKNRTIKFRAKSKISGMWVIGTSDFKPSLLSSEVPLNHFWKLVEEGILLRKTVGQWVEFTNFDGSKGEGFEGDIIRFGGDNHNGVITFGDDYGQPGFYTKESRLRKEKYNRYHGLPPNTNTVEIIGNIWDEPKLASRWGRS